MPGGPTIRFSPRERHPAHPGRGEPSRRGRSATATPLEAISWEWLWARRASWSSHATPPRPAPPRSWLMACTMSPVAPLPGLPGGEHAAAANARATHRDDRRHDVPPPAAPTGGESPAPRDDAGRQGRGLQGHAGEVDGGGSAGDLGLVLNGNQLADPTRSLKAGDRISDKCAWTTRCRSSLRSRPSWWWSPPPSPGVRGRRARRAADWAARLLDPPVLEPPVAEPPVQQAVVEQAVVEQAPLLVEGGGDRADRRRRARLRSGATGRTGPATAGTPLRRGPGSIPVPPLAVPLLPVLPPLPPPPPKGVVYYCAGRIPVLDLDRLRSWLTLGDVSLGRLAIVSVEHRQPRLRRRAARLRRRRSSHRGDHATPPHGDPPARRRRPREPRALRARVPRRAGP